MRTDQRGAREGSSIKVRNTEDGGVEVKEDDAWDDWNGEGSYEDHALSRNDRLERRHRQEFEAGASVQEGVGGRAPFDRSRAEANMASVPGYEQHNGLSEFERIGGDGEDQQDG